MKKFKLKQSKVQVKRKWEYIDLTIDVPGWLPAYKWQHKPKPCKLLLEFNRYEGKIKARIRRLKEMIPL